MFTEFSLGEAVARHSNLGFWGIKLWKASDQLFVMPSQTSLPGTNRTGMAESVPHIGLKLVPPATARTVVRLRSLLRRC